MVFFFPLLLLVQESQTWHAVPEVDILVCNLFFYMEAISPSYNSAHSRFLVRDVPAKLLQWCPTLRPYGPTGSSVHGSSQAIILECIALPSAGDLPDPGIKPMSPVAPALQEDSLPLSHRISAYVFLYSVSFCGFTWLVGA